MHLLPRFAVGGQSMPPTATELAVPPPLLALGYC